MIRVLKIHADEMIAHSLEENPNECCGILSGTNDTSKKLYQITNSANSPYRYLMDPQEFLKADLDTEQNGMDFLAFYHSHTHSPAYPSVTDVRMALQSGYLDVFYILISLEDHSDPQIRAFFINETGEISEQQIEITGAIAS